MSSELPCISMNLTAPCGTPPAAGRWPRPGHPPGRRRRAPRPSSSRARNTPNQTIVRSKPNMTAASRSFPPGRPSFCQKGYHGTSMGDWRRRSASRRARSTPTWRASRISSTRRCARAPRLSTACSTRSPRRSGGREDPARAPRPPAGRRRPARARHGLRAGVALPRRRAPGAVRRPSGGATRSGYGRSSARPRAGRAALRPRRRCGGAPLPFGRELGLTWLREGADTDALADAFYALLVDGMRGYSTPELSDFPTTVAACPAALIVNPRACGSPRS